MTNAFPTAAGDPMATDVSGFQRDTSPSEPTARADPSAEKVRTVPSCVPAGIAPATVCPVCTSPTNVPTSLAIASRVPAGLNSSAQQFTFVGTCTSTPAGPSTVTKPSRVDRGDEIAGIAHRHPAGVRQVHRQLTHDGASRGVPQVPVAVSPGADGAGAARRQHRGLVGLRRRAAASGRLRSRSTLSTPPGRTRCTGRHAASARPWPSVSMMRCGSPPSGPQVASTLVPSGTRPRRPPGRHRRSRPPGLRPGRRSPCGSAGRPCPAPPAGAASRRRRARRDPPQGRAAR